MAPCCFCKSCKTVRNSSGAAAKVASFSETFRIASRESGSSRSFCTSPSLVGLDDFWFFLAEESLAFLFKTFFTAGCNLTVSATGCAREVLLRWGFVEIMNNSVVVHLESSMEEKFGCPFS